MKRAPASVALAALLWAAPMLAAWPAAEAEARPRSSGGYSRPSSGGYSRTPSFRPSAPPVRTPSSGGYSRPGGGGFSTGGYDRSPSVSGADRGYNRDAAGDALRRLRERDAAAQRPTAPSPSAAPRRDGGYAGGYDGGGWGGSWGGNWNTGRTGYGRGSGGSYGGPDWYRQRGWNPGGAVLAGPRGFGVWDAAFLWFMLSTLNRPGHAEFFHNHRDDPGFDAWRRQVEQAAQNDPEVRQQLQQLDRELSGRAGQPRDPDYLPPDVPPEVATADRSGGTDAPSGGGSAGSSGSGGGTVGVVGVLLVGGALLALLAWRRSRRRGEARGEAMRTGTAGTLASAAGMLRHKMSGEGYAPDRFRPGMSVTLDPTPFLLLAGSGKAALPDAAGGRASVAAVGRLGEGDSRLVRLYLSEAAMLQLHPGAGDGDGGSDLPSECRYFSRLDEITPADEAEWEAWLHPAEGMIGWPEFQTHDGKTYARAWSPGAAKAPPRALTEALQSGTDPAREVRHEAMLYAAPTGAADPAPATEYVLVQTVEDGARAWVEVWAGIDVNPASLGLAG